MEYGGRLGRGAFALAGFLAFLDPAPGAPLEDGGISPLASRRSTALGGVEACSWAAAQGSGPVTLVPRLAPLVQEPSNGNADYDWILRRLNGNEVKLEEFRGQVLFINMWATWCEPCVQELESIQDLMASPAAREVVFVLVSPEDPEPVERFLRIHGYDLPVFLEVQDMPPAFGLEVLPTTWIVDRDGRIVLKHRGIADWNQSEVAELLRMLAPGRS